jgi:23S rRNA (pseudouridine1915-N3)-methyltransferase
MRIHIIAIGKKMPGWVNTAYQEYSKRFPNDFKVNLTEIPPAKRSTARSDIHRIVEEEGNQILKCISAQTKVIALDVIGERWSTEQLANQLTQWETDTSQLSFVIGGPDGLSQSCLNRAHHRWSLSPLTFPHPLVRVILIEQLYRAISFMRHHPYHRI